MIQGPNLGYLQWLQSTYVLPGELGTYSAVAARACELERIVLEPAGTFLIEQMQFGSYKIGLGSRRKVTGVSFFPGLPMRPALREAELVRVQLRNLSAVPSAALFGFMVRALDDHGAVVIDSVNIGGKDQLLPLRSLLVLTKERSHDG